MRSQATTFGCFFVVKSHCHADTNWLKFFMFIRALNSSVANGSNETKQKSHLLRENCETMPNEEKRRCKTRRWANEALEVNDDLINLSFGSSVIVGRIITNVQCAHVNFHYIELIRKPSPLVLATLDLLTCSFCVCVRCVYRLSVLFQ